MDAKRMIVGTAVAAWLGLSGCAAVLIGAGAAGGYALSKDSVKNHFDISRDRVYARSLRVAKEMGLVTLEDAKKGLIKAEVKGADVTITVEPVTKKTVELKVKAKDRFLVPKVDIAQEVYTKIIEKF